jgi:hypothetical protein
LELRECALDFERYVTNHQWLRFVPPVLSCNHHIDPPAMLGMFHLFPPNGSLLCTTRGPNLIPSTDWISGTADSPAPSEKSVIVSSLKFCQKENLNVFNGVKTRIFCQGHGRGIPLNCVRYSRSLGDPPLHSAVCLTPPQRHNK